MSQHHPSRRVRAGAIAIPLLFTPIAAGALFSASAQAADSDAVVVTATRQATRASEVLSDITVIDRAEIERFGGATLPELLGSLPGVQTTPNGGRGASGALSIRGGNTNHVLILLDGQRISSATTGTTAIEHLPLDQIERVEILRGPASSLYGADALSGVIQIFSRQGEGKPRPTVSLGAGRYGTVIGSAAYGGQIGDSRFNIQVGQERTSGSGSIKAAKGGEFDMYNPDNDPYDNSNLAASFSHKLSSALEVGGDYLYAKGMKHFDAASCSSTWPWPCTPNFDSRQKQELESASAFVKYRINPGWDTSVRVGQSNDQTRSWLFDPLINLVNIERYDTRQNQFSWQNNFTVAGGKLMAAAEWRGINVASTQQLIATEQNTKALVLGYQGWFGDHSFQASGRRDDISRLGGQTTGSFAYGYRFAPRWVARASIGTSYHAPTFNDLYWPLDRINYYQGNPNLRPERSRNREIGVSYDAAGTTAGLTLYTNSVTDLIDFVAGTAPTYIGTSENVSQATLKGATLHYARSNEVWDWKLNYDVLSARNDADGKTLQRRAPHTGSLNIRRHFQGFDIGLQLTATSSRFNDSKNTQSLGGYALANLDANYRLDKDWTLFGRISNLFDKDYVQVRSTMEPYNDYAVAGRSIFVGFRYAPK